MIPLIFIDNKLFYFHFAFTKIIQQFNVYLINKLNFSYLIKIIMNNTYIIDAVRTPVVGRYGGVLSSIRLDDLAALVIKALLERSKSIDIKLIEDVILGCTNQAGKDNRNIARMASLLAGLPVEVGGVTVNRLCASGMQAIMDAARAVMVGDGDIFIAGGVESMSRAPYIISKSEKPFDGKPEIYDSTIGWRFTNKKLTSTVNDEWAPIAKFFELNKISEIKNNNVRFGNLTDDDAIKLCKIINRKAPIALEIAEKLIDEAQGCEEELKELNNIFSTQDTLLGLTSIGKKVEFTGT